MGKDKKKKLGGRLFATGRRGCCEALLYEFRERSPSVAESDDSKSAGQQKPHTARIAANTFDEALEHLRWDQPHFVIDNVQNLGLIVMVSGTPLD